MGSLAAMNEGQPSQFGMQFVDLHEAKIDESLFGFFSAQDLSERGALPIAQVGDSIVVAVGDPYDLDLEAELTLSTGRHIRSVLADPQEISKALKHRFGVGSSALDDDTEDGEASFDDFGEGADLDDLGEQRTVSKLVTELLEDALSKAQVTFISKMKRAFFMFGIASMVCFVWFTFRQRCHSIAPQLSAELRFWPN